MPNTLAFKQSAKREKQQNETILIFVGNYCIKPDDDGQMIYEPVEELDFQFYVPFNRFMDGCCFGSRDDIEYGGENLIINVTKSDELTPEQLVRRMRRTCGEDYKYIILRGSPEQKLETYNKEIARDMALLKGFTPDQEEEHYEEDALVAV